MGRSSEVDDASDEALVLLARDGDVSAFEQLVLRHEQRVLRVLRLLGVSLQDREDVAQEVFVRVFRHLGGFRRGRSFSGWIYRITVNAAHDHRGRRLRRAEGAWSGEVEDSPDDAPGPREVLEQEDRRRLLESALQKISERERAVFVLRELEGMETHEVARALGITRITVRRHLGRARSHLRELLSDDRKSEENEGPR